jgi:alpha-tubulin suppressor-like RCC1 family protein
MTTGFRINGTDTDDLFVRKDIFTEGGLWGWGLNNLGQLGDNTIISKSSPVQTVSGGTNWKFLAYAGDYGPRVIKSDGTLWLWGWNNTGQLGDNTTTSKSSPIQTVSGGTNWKQVGICMGTFSAAIKTDGTLWLWGLNSTGQLGDNTTTDKSSPVQTISGGTNWKQVAGGSGHTAAIKTDGTLWTWGSNVFGELGDNTTTSKSSPVQTISGGTNWKQVSCGSEHSAAIKTDGTLWLWGRNQFGQLGNNARTSISSPVQTVSGGTNWKQLSCGVYYTAAIKTDGTLWLWGQGTSGQLGDNTITHRSSPVQTVSGGTNWKQVSCGVNNTAAIKTDGTLWLWGSNVFGELGDNTTTSKSSPVQTISGGTNWKQVCTAGGSSGYNTIAIRGDYWA